ncbi:serine hydrolase family protein [Candidatus Woesearchaeota archaeon]|nr:serine hydrolase family protein [Candidatus Woesearchaeota archaeon]
MLGSKKVPVFIFHGAYGNPQENWFPWLKKELEKCGCEVYVPQFPTPENQCLESWKTVFENYKDKVTENSILIGHSIGATFLLHILENREETVKAAFLVAGFISPLKNAQFDELNTSFLKEMDWLKIQKNCKRTYVFHSDNDPYVPLKFGKELSEKLGIGVTIVKKAGHFNENIGYKEFPLLLDLIKRTAHLKKRIFLSLFK